MEKYEKLLDFSEVYINDKPNLSDNVISQIYHLSDIVINKHYSFLSIPEKEELKAIATLKAIELIMSMTFEPGRSSLKNYLYTGMRNEMSNYLYKSKKEIPQEEFYEGSEDTDLNDEVFISLGDFNRFKIKYKLTQSHSEQLALALRRMGFTLDIEISKSDLVSDEYEIDKWKCLFLWERVKAFT